MNPMKYYVDAEGNYLGGWDANPPDGSTEVPFAPDHASQKWVGGEWLPHIPPAPPLCLELVGAVSMTVAPWEVTEVARLKGVAMAFMADENLAWVFFTEEQPDTDYIVTPADGVTKFTGYFEVDCAGASSKNLIVQRVQ